MYAVVKTLHVVFFVSWYAGLFYLPRLFVYHAMTPAAVLTIVFGLWLWLGYGVGGGWMHAKLALVAVLIALHAYLGVLVRAFAADRNRHGHVYYRWLNEIPALPLLVAIVYLVIAKPF